MQHYADQRYNYILDHPYDKIAVVDFFTKEAHNFVQLKQLLDKCKSEKDFEDNKEEIIKLTQYVRLSKIPLIKENYLIFQFTKKKIVDDLIKILKNKEHE